MAKPCDHWQNLTAAHFPPPRTPGAWEECLKEADVEGLGRTLASFLTKLKAEGALNP